MYHVIRIEEHPVPFLLVALILCGSICWFVFLEPAWDWYRSRNWVKCPATVTYSKIQ